MTPLGDISKVTALTAAQSASLFRWSDDPFGGRQYGLVWASEALAHYLVEADGVAVSHVGVLAVRMQAGGEEFGALGFGGVITRPERQKQGLASRLMRFAADDQVKALRETPGVLFCEEHRLGFYAKLGWRERPGAVWVRQPSGEVKMPLRFMTLGGRGSLPDGDLHVLGLPW